MNTRRKAAFIIARWLLVHEPPQDMLPNGPERSFVQDLVYVTIRRFRPLRRVLGELVEHWPKGELEALLLVGAAQILYMPDVPDFAAVSETVEAAKKCPNKSVAKVVNGVLRNLLRRRVEFEAMLAATPLAERESYPNALVARWIARYGEESAARLAAWHNDPAETWLAHRSGEVERLPRGRRVDEVPGYADGEFVVQDPATLGAVELLDVGPGMSVLDFCAAPGGKTAQIAWRMKGEGRLVAQEVNPRRLERLRANLARLKLDWVEPVGAVPLCGVESPDSPDGGESPCGSGSPDSPDGRVVLGQFDRVLVDAPCSNTGVLRRRPDARWRWSAERLAELVTLQREVLAAAACFVAPGGLLVYSTCSNEPEENEERISAFIAGHPDFKEIARRVSFPLDTGHDGAFAVAFRRCGENMV